MNKPCPFCGEEPKFIADDSYGVEYVLWFHATSDFQEQAGKC